MKSQKHPSVAGESFRTNPLHCHGYRPLFSCLAGAGVAITRTWRCYQGPQSGETKTACTDSKTEASGMWVFFWGGGDQWTVMLMQRN